MNPHDLVHVEVGSFWEHKRYGSVYEVIERYPSIGGTTSPEFTLRHIRTDETYVRSYADMCIAGLEPLDSKDVPMALLGGS